MNMLQRTICTTILVSLSISLTGCHVLKKDDGVERDWMGREVEIEYETPNKVVAIWSNSVFNEAGGKPIRGLGGRVYFYDEHTPVEVDGKLSVFLYDDTEQKTKKKQEASKVVHFTAEQVAANYSPSEFGASYSFWVPWDEVGGKRTQLSVIPVFTDADGQMLVGDQARHMLPGSDPVEFIDEDQGIIEQASYSNDNTVSKDGRVVRASLTTDDGERKVYSTKIQLPSTMQKRLKKQPPKRDLSKARGSWSNATDRTSSEFSPASKKPLKSGADSGLQPGEIQTTTKTPKAIAKPLARSRPIEPQAPFSPSAPQSFARVESTLAPSK